MHWGAPPALGRTPYTAAYPSLASRRDFSPLALRPTPSCTAALPPTNALRCVFFIDQVQGWEVKLPHRDRSVKGGDCEIYRDDCILISGFPPVMPSQSNRKKSYRSEEKRFYIFYCGFILLLPRKGVTGGYKGIYRGKCILIPGFPPVTPSQGSIKNDTVQRRSAFNLIS